MNRGYNIPEDTVKKIYDIYFNTLKKIILKYSGKIDILSLTKRDKISLTIEILLSKFNFKKTILLKTLRIYEF